ncbi:MAG: hypothetical protein H2174_00840 [Vampirovibrio sp.]|nr:hypothetical protein [Vampirovibrio sp.]
MGYLGYGGGYGGGFGGGYGMYPSSVLGSGYFGSYIYNNAGGYSSGVPTNPAFKAPELNEAQSMPLIDFPLYHGPNIDINDPAHRPVLFSDKWINQSSPKEKTFDLLMTGTALLAIGFMTTFAVRGLLATPGNIVRDATRRW